MKYQHQYMMYDEVEHTAYLFIVGSAMNRPFKVLAGNLSRDLFPIWDKVIKEQEETISIPSCMNEFSPFMIIIVDSKSFSGENLSIRWRSAIDYLCSIHRYFRNIC